MKELAILNGKFSIMSTKKMTYINFEFLSNALEEAFEQGNNFHLRCLEAIADEIAGCEKLMPGSEVVLLEGGFGKWLNSKPELGKGLKEMIKHRISPNLDVKFGSLDFKSFRRI